MRVSGKNKNDIDIKDEAVIEAVETLFVKAQELGLVKYKTAFEDRLDAINDIFEDAFNSGLMKAEEFEEIGKPEAIIEEIAKRKVVIMSSQKKPEPSLKEAFKKVVKEIKKPGKEQDEKVYFDAGRAIGTKIDKTSRKVTGAVGKAVRGIFKRNR